MKDLEFTLEREDILRALREEYEPLGLSVTDLTEVDDTMIGVLTPTAVPGRRLDARLDDTGLMTSVARHVLRVIGLVVVRSERVAEGEMRIWAQLSDGRCPTCGSPVGGGGPHPGASASAPVDFASSAETTPASRSSRRHTGPRSTEPAPSLTAEPGTAGRTLPVPNRVLLVTDHEVVTVPSLTPQVVARMTTPAGEVERLEIDIPSHMESPKDA